MSRNKKIIAIIRGGLTDRYRSLQNGAKVILDLAKYNDEVKAIDVIIDEDQNWYERGIPSSPHKVFSEVDYYLDFTDNFKSGYHNLAKRLKVKQILQNNYADSLNRVSLNRLLEQIGTKVPKYSIIRKSDNLELSLKNIWNKFQMPIVIKEVRHDFNDKSILTNSYLEAIKYINDMLSKDKEVIIQEYANGEYISIAILPKYREMENYIPTAIQVRNFNPFQDNLNSRSLNQKCLIDHDCEKESFVFADDSLKKSIQNFAKNIQETLSLNQHIMLDLVVIKDKNNQQYIFKVLDIHLKPNLFPDSRFDFILKNSGVDLGRYIIDNFEY